MDGIATRRLALRRWREEDRAVFHRLNSDDAIMRFFAFRMSRAEADETLIRWNAGLDENAMSFLAAERREDGVVVGTIGLAPITEPAYAFAPCVQIGWRLLPEATGRGYATEGARACLAHAFGPLGLRDVVSQCAEGNHESEAVMLRLGMRPRGRFAHPKVPLDTHPHLSRHLLYGLTAAEWRERPPEG